MNLNLRFNSHILGVDGFIIHPPLEYDQDRVKANWSKEIVILHNELNSFVETMSSAEAKRLAIEATDVLSFIEKFEMDLLSTAKKAYDRSRYSELIEGRVYQKQFLRLLEQTSDHLKELSDQIKTNNESLLLKVQTAVFFIAILGTIVGFFLFLSVFTAISQAVTKNQVQGIMQTMGHLLFVADLDGTVTDTNRKVKEVLGFNKKEVMNLKLAELFDSKSPHFQSLEAVFSRFQPGAKELETTLVSKSGEKIPVLVSGNILLDEENNPTDIVVSAQDIRDIKSMQGQLIQSEKMASLGTIAAGVAHEINNPMAFIQANLETVRGYMQSIRKLLENYFLLEAHVQTGNDPSGLKLVSEIKAQKEEEDLDHILVDVGQALTESLDGVNRVKEIVQNLKNFSRSDLGNFEKIDLNTVIEGSLKLILNDVKYKCEVVKDYGQLPMIFCFHRQISQVFVNLLMNAAQAIETHGKIVIRSQVEGSKIIVSISDTGVGIPKDMFTKIFDPFYTTKEVGVGTGLGLSISYGIVKKHRGSIEVESELGKGTTFRVILPIETA